MGLSPTPHVASNHSQTKHLPNSYSSRMPISVLLSIKPRFADAIFLGHKCFEFRRAIFRNRDITNVLVYASSPVCRVIGEFTIETILAMQPSRLWRATSSGSGINREYFDEYFEGREIAYALKVRDAVRYEMPLGLTEYLGLSRPPQSFCYIYGKEPRSRGRVSALA